MSHHLTYPSYPEDRLPAFLLPWWVKYRTQVLTDLSKGKNARRSFFGSSSDNLLFYPPISYIMEKKMNGRKPQKSSNKPSSKPQQSTSIQWVNCPLEDQDYSDLEQSTVELEVLAADLIGLVGDGYGCSVKYDFERERFNCTIYRSGGSNNSRSLGLSGHAPNVRDAVLVTLYRFHNKCGGTLDDNTPVSTPNQQGRRFG